jgi:hypothetical protein
MDVNWEGLTNVECSSNTGRMFLFGFIFRGFQHHITDRCVRTTVTCRHSIEGIPSISVVSNSYSVLNTNHDPHKISEWKKHAEPSSVVPLIIIREEHGMKDRGLTPSKYAIDCLGRRGPTPRILVGTMIMKA